MLPGSPYRPPFTLLRQRENFARERNIHKHSAKSLFEETIIVREQHTRVQGRDRAFREELDPARKAFSLSAKIRRCSLFIVGFAVIVAVFGGTSSSLLMISSHTILTQLTSITSSEWLPAKKCSNVCSSTKYEQRKMATQTK
jgi:hypothetical protein